MSIERLTNDVAEIKNVLSRLLPLLESIHDRQIEDGKDIASIKGRLTGIDGRLASMDLRMSDQTSMVQLALASRVSRPG